VPVNDDPIASLTAWPINLNIGGRQYTIPAEPASTWLLALLDEFGSFEAVIEMFSVADKAQIEQDVIDGTLDEQDKTKAFRDAVEIAAGRPWWVVVNYLNLLRGFWARFHGRILISGLNPEQVSLGAYLDAAHYAFIENRDEQAAQKILNFLETPPPGLEIELDEDVEGDTFLAMLNQSR